MLTCQSCGMDVEKDENKGTNSDGSLSTEYCVHCYKDGAFTNDFTLEQYVDKGLEYSPDYRAAKTDSEKETIKKQMIGYLSNLKRWKA
ncbi:zinc ribbon domain-containing protein [Carnobacterium gallinarum]|uniref:zinc ribbon domain-containing protein n=1 Tax=Carnobacterium gallinarum TaxID=2749 RepID=UPI00054F9E26|nr:zinc ribbon domain-containing protein [Carnobacterium gallinarum]